jgi:hypothetical protein
VIELRRRTFISGRMPAWKEVASSPDHAKYGLDTLGGIPDHACEIVQPLRLGALQCDQDPDAVTGRDGMMPCGPYGTCSAEDRLVQNRGPRHEYNIKIAHNRWSSGGVMDADHQHSTGGSSDFESEAVGNLRSGAFHYIDHRIERRLQQQISMPAMSIVDRISANTPLKTGIAFTFATIAVGRRNYWGNLQHIIPTAMEVARTRKRNATSVGTIVCTVICDFQLGSIREPRGTASVYQCRPAS